MLQKISVYFQWSRLTPGSSTRHNCNMEPASADISERLESTREKIRDVWSRSGLVISDSDMKQADLAAMRLAWLSCQPLEIEKAKRPGGRRKDSAAQAAAIVIEYFEEITESKVDRPASNRNNKPRGLEPLVRKVLDVCGFDCTEKGAFNAVSKLVRRGTVIKRPVETAEEYFEWASHKEGEMKYAKLAAWHAEQAKRGSRFRK
jgi:hypothetical protein